MRKSLAGGLCALALLVSGCANSDEPKKAAESESPGVDAEVKAYMTAAGPHFIEGATRFRYTIGDSTKYRASAPAVANVRARLAAIEAPPLLAGEAAIAVESLETVADAYVAMSDSRLDFSSGPERTDPLRRSFDAMRRYQDAVRKIYQLAGMTPPIELFTQVPKTT